MKKLYLLLLTAGLSATVFAQEKFELGKPNNSDYRYLDEYKALKEYIDYEKYPNFKLGIGTTVDTYLDNPTFRNLVNKNFTETVAGNAMKMSSCVHDDGSMNFNKVKNYVNTATQAGLNVYGHTLAWHSQQANGWLRSLLADKVDIESSASDSHVSVASYNFENGVPMVGWGNNSTRTIVNGSHDGSKCLKINNPSATNSWSTQVAIDFNTQLSPGTIYYLHFWAKVGSGTYSINAAYQNPADYSGRGDYPNFTLTTTWKEYTLKTTIKGENCKRLCFNLGTIPGDIYLDDVEVYFMGSTIPLTAQERHDTLVWAMDKWIKGMMDACGGKVKAWDLVNEAIADEGDDGSGNCPLQHSDGYKSGTWDVGGNAFYWQDYLGDLDYVRQACRLARKYGPSDIVLFINDYNLESDWDKNKKVKSLVNWIKKWESDGVTKIDGIGTQMHISCFEYDAPQDSVKKYMTQMFQIIANSGKLCRVSEMDMGYVRGSNRWGSSVKTDQLTEAEHKKMADFYEWIIKEYFRIIPPAQQWGICQWCPTDAPADSKWRGGEPVGIWDLNYYRKHAYAGFVRGLNGGEPAGIGEIETDSTAPSAIYSLSGVRQQATSLSQLPAGIYIVNGKKVVK